VLAWLVLAGAASQLDLPGFVQLAPSTRLFSAARTQLRRLPRFAEDEGASESEPEGETQEAPEAAVAEAATPEEPAEAPAAKPVAPLFQELNVSATSDRKKIKGALIAIFNTGDRAADLVLLSPRNKSTMLYAIAELPTPFEAAAQFLMRHRDRRMRVRVLQKFAPTPDDDAQEMRISSKTNSTKLGSAIMSKFVDVAGNNLKRTVKLEFQGEATATIAMEAIEKAQHKAHRQFTWTVRKVFKPEDEGGVCLSMVVVAA